MLFYWELSGDKLYFGGENGVLKLILTQMTNGSDIFSDVQQAFSNYGDNTAQKHFKMVRPIFVSEADVTLHW